MSDSPIRLAIFDLGGVLFTTDPQRAFSYWAERYGRDPADLRASFVADRVFADFEKGLVTEQAYYEHFCRIMGIRFAYEDFEKGWCAIYGDVWPETREAIRVFKEIYRIPVVALTNTNVTHARVWPHKYRAELAAFDAVYASHVMGLRKPERECFEFVLNRHGNHPESTMFFDDNETNIHAAHKLGMKTVHVQSPDSITAALRNMR